MNGAASTAGIGALIFQIEAKDRGKLDERYPRGLDSLRGARPGRERD